MKLINAKNLSVIKPGNQKSFNDWLAVLLVIGIVLVLITNLFRVMLNAKNNYEVYLYEKEGWAILQEERDRLSEELEFYQSYEYKKLYARDYLHLGESGETLYKVLGGFEYYDVKDDVRDLFPKENFLSWWKLLI